MRGGVYYFNEAFPPPALFFSFVGGYYFYRGSYFLKINEIKECCIVIGEHDLSYYDINTREFILSTKGCYKVFVGQSANINDLILQKEVSVE